MRRFTSMLKLASVGLVLLLSAGCLPNVSWLPDSSGFVFSEGHRFRQLSHYDVNRATKRVIVADTAAAASWPSVSPDGKQIAIARLLKKPNGEYGLRVVCYDLAGSELHQSPELAWRPADPTTGGGDQDPQVTGVHWSRDGKKLIVHDYHDKKPQSGIYDVASKRLKLLEGTPTIVGGTPLRPDGKAFLLARAQGDDSIVMLTADWDGKEELVALEPELLDDQAKRIVLVYPIFGTSRWDGPSANITFGLWRFNVDTQKRLGTIARVPDETALVNGRQITQQHRFPTGAAARVLSDRGNSPDAKEHYRLEFLRAGDKDPQIILEKTDGMFLFAPSPDGKRLAIRHTTGDADQKQRIIVVNAKGEVERTVEVEQ